MATPMTKPSDPIANNHTKALVLALNEHVEEDVTLLIEGTVINCFISYCINEIEVGKSYDVELVLNIPDHYEIQKVEPRKTLAEKTGRGYSYFLYGELRNELFLSFTPLNGDGVHYDHPDCNDHFIKLEVERIDVAFL